MEQGMRQQLEDQERGWTQRVNKMTSQHRAEVKKVRARLTWHGSSGRASAVHAGAAAPSVSAERKRLNVTVNLTETQHLDCASNEWCLSCNSRKVSMRFRKGT